MQSERKRWYKDEYMYISCGVCFLMALCSFVYYIWRGDGVFTLMTDFRAQQVPFAIGANDAVKSGQWGWLWNADLGTNIIGTYSFYNLGSPFFWVSLLFPAESFPYIVGWIYILKYAAAGVAAYLYIRRFVSKREFAVLGAVLYAFSGFQTTNLFFYHFHDVAAFFPFLLLGVEKLVVDRKKGYFAAAVFINCLLNYFFFAGEAIFLIIYFLCRFGLKKDMLHDVVSCCLEGILGIGMACILFLPSLLFIASNPKAENSILGSGQWFYQGKRYLEIIRGILLPAEPMHEQSAIAYEDFTSTSAYLPGVGLVLAAAFLLKEKGWIRRLLGLSLLISLFPYLNDIFYGFSQDYRRWWYMPVLILALASAKAMDKEQYNFRKAAWIVSGVILLFAGWMAFTSGAGQNRNEIYSGVRFWGMIIFVLLCNLIMIITQKNRYLFGKAVWVMVIFTSVMTTAWMLYKYEPEQTPQELKAKWDGDRTLTDIDINYRYNVDNSGSYIGGVHPLLTYSSTITGSIYEMHREMGLSRTPATVNLDVPGVMQWLGGKYYLTDEKSDDLQIVDVLNYGDHQSYVAEQAACPIGFTYENYILKSEFIQLENRLRGIAALRGLVIPDEEQQTVSKYLNKLDIQTVHEEDIPYIDSYSEINAAHIVNIYEMNAKGFRAEADCEKGTYAFFSVPNDSGWSAYVNGKEVPIMNVNGLMAIPLEKGKEEIQFIYEIPGLKAGAFISLISITGWILYIFYAGKGIKIEKSR